MRISANVTYPWGNYSNAVVDVEVYDKAGHRGECSECASGALLIQGAHLSRCCGTLREVAKRAEAVVGIGERDGSGDRVDCMSLGTKGRGYASL